MSFQLLNKEYYFKIILFGDSGVGKTTLSKRLTTNIFFNYLKKTIGVELFSKTYYIENIAHTLLIWDYSGEDRFKPMLKMWLKGTMGGIFVYDITNYKSFLHLGKWLNFVTKEKNGFPIIMVGTHSDLENKREISEEKAKNTSKMLNYPFFECSSKNGDNIENIFQTIIENLHISRKKNHLTIN
jgi:small GTP-binding protein